MGLDHKGIIQHLIFMHRNSCLILEKYGKEFFAPGCSVLEIGASGPPSDYQKLFGAKAAKWDTLEIGSDFAIPPTYVSKDEYNFPVPSDAYDVVISGQVIEHVRKIWRWFPELARICKPGGVVITINPVSWHYHEAPVDCWRIYPEGMKALAEDAGLEVLLSTWESVEIQRLWFLPARLRRKNSLLLLSGPAYLLSYFLRWPFQGAFDTITIARKPQPTAEKPGP
ncbi:hypothetical protein CU048_08215 [Beijerinckiaceae bacterium]|nr:hypothetical protein CU048_08215 [Beijerinckiaceae bacterium]